MSQPPSVAIVRSDNRRGAVAEALALINDQIPASLAGEVVLLPDFGSTRHPRVWTQPATLAAMLDALLSWGPDRALVLVPDASRLDRSNYRRETFGRPVDYQFDPLPNEANAWTRCEFDLGDGQPVGIRVNAILDRRPSLISIATMKTAGTSSVALTLANALSLVHPADRELVDPDLGTIEAGSAILGQWRRAGAKIRERFTGSWESIASARDAIKPPRFGPRAIEIPRHSEQLARLMTSLAATARPAISLVDGFVALEGDCPRRGTFRTRRVVIAGTDPVAVDAVAARTMGFDPNEIAHLRHAQALGLGETDLGAIRLVGDPINSVDRPCVPHSDHEILRHADRLAGSRPGAPATTPHARRDRSRTR